MRIARLALSLVLIAGLMFVGLGYLGPKASAQGGKVIRFGVNRAPETLDPVFGPLWRAASSDEARLRVVIDQVASLTDATALDWHARLVTSLSGRRQS